MSGKRISPDRLSATNASGRTTRRDEAPRAAVATRVLARVFAARFDRMLAVGVPAREGSALAVHAARLVSPDEREVIARTLRRSVDDAHNRQARLSARVPLNVPNIIAAERRLDEITLRLHSPRPVMVRGMARLRVLLADGTGPMYRYGRGDLEGRLGAALAAL